MTKELGVRMIAETTITKEQAKEERMQSVTHLVAEKPPDHNLTPDESFMTDKISNSANQQAFYDTTIAAIRRECTVSQSPPGTEKALRTISSIGLRSGSPDQDGGGWTQKCADPKPGTHGGEPNRRRGLQGRGAFSGDCGEREYFTAACDQLPIRHASVGRLAVGGRHLLNRLGHRFAKGCRFQDFGV